MLKLLLLQRFQGLPDRGRRPEYRRGRPVIQSASPRLARALFLVTRWKRDHRSDSGRSRHRGHASSQPPHLGPREASLGRCGLAPTQRLTLIRPPHRHAMEAEGKRKGPPTFLWCQKVDGPFQPREWSTIGRRRAGRNGLICPKKLPGSVTY